jgi:hypothetical protein
MLLRDGGPATCRWLRLLQRAGIAVSALSVGQPRLDDVFLELTEAR